MRHSPLKICKECKTEPVVSFRHQFCEACGKERSHKAANRSQVEALAERKEAIKKPEVAISVKSGRMTDAEQREIDRACALRHAQTNITSPAVLHVVRQASWLWRSA